MRPVVCTKPVIPSMKVVLPAPFGPISPTSLPCSTLEVDLVHGPETAEGDGHVTGLEQGHQLPPALAAVTATSASGGDLADRRPSTWRIWAAARLKAPARPSGFLMALKMRPTPPIRGT